MIMPTRPRVLYVDNDDESCEMIKLTLEAAAIEVTCVSNSAEALLLAAKTKFDLFLLDLRWKDDNATELCTKLRNVLPEIPVVLYTGAAGDRERRTGLASGAAAYLIKPYSELIAPTVFRLVAGMNDVGRGRHTSQNYDQSHIRIRIPSLDPGNDSLAIWP